MSVGCVRSNRRIGPIFIAQGNWLKRTSNTQYYLKSDRSSLWSISVTLGLLALIILLMFIALFDLILEEGLIQFQYVLLIVLQFQSEMVPLIQTHYATLASLTACLEVAPKDHIVL